MGRIKSFQTDLFNTDVDLASSASIGANFGIPINDSGMKVELMVNHQSTNFTTESGIVRAGIEPRRRRRDVLPRRTSRSIGDSRNVTPFFVVSAGLANVDPKFSNVSSENRFSASAGVGVKVPVNRNLGIRVEGRGYFTSLSNSTDSGCSRCGFSNSDENLYQGEVNIGVTFKF